MYVYIADYIYIFYNMIICHIILKIKKDTYFEKKAQAHRKLWFSFHALQKPVFDLFNLKSLTWKIPFLTCGEITFSSVCVGTGEVIWASLKACTLIKFRGLTRVGLPRCLLYIYSFLCAWQMCSQLHKAQTLAMSMWTCCSKWKLPLWLFQPW